ncbi:uncharacterized protein FPRN_15065 [Fusarium proliferatum]|nr:uncharacterized protein FPRN_15065 [Fusarium proliferatum]
MDPASAFGLAASVAQFVTFTSALISKGAEIYRSTSGLSSDISTVEAIYRKLHDLECTLTAPVHDLGGQCTKQVEAIAELSRACHADCKQLLATIAKLKVQDGPGHKWKSFRAALKTHWKDGDITKLEDRLHKTQTSLTLQICTISSYYHDVHIRTLRELQLGSERLKIDQTCRLDKIQQALGEIRQRVLISPQPGQSFSPVTITDIERELSSMSIAENDITKQQSILQSLTFAHRSARHAAITDAHIRTFEWIFKEDSVCGGAFLDWLNNGNGIFWVSGKPGSGKSTLMKFIADHSRTARILSAWSSPKPTYVASHYFWSAGTKMQRSQEGLLQTLLYEIFRQCPDLLQVACHQRWQDVDPEHLSKPWNLSELRIVLKEVADEADISQKFCFFVDGLDEFTGDRQDLCQDLVDLSQSPNIKLCISSRPWNVFEQNFGGDPGRKLYIHQLTHNDIRSYTELRLLDHPGWKTLESEVMGAHLLIDQVTERSRGVFLWVFFVTKLLREGLEEDDSFSDLCRRLESFPSDLEPFFKHMLETVQPIHHEKMSGVLAIAIKARSPLDISIYRFHSLEYESVDYALERPVETQDEQEEKVWYRKTKRRLNGWCRGLLEVKQGRVDFLHRTVMDFLRTKEMSDFLRAKNTDGFNANLSILRAYTAWIKTTPSNNKILRTGPGSYSDTPLASRIREAITYAGELEDETDNYTQAEIVLLDTIEATMCAIDRKTEDRVFPISEGFNSDGAKLFFREHIVKKMLSKYLSHKVREVDYFNEFEMTPLAMVIHSELWPDRENLPWPEKCIRMLKLLLESGESPNDQFELNVKHDSHQATMMSAWAMLFFWIVPSLIGEIGPKFIPTLQSDLLPLFLKHKANPNALVWRLEHGLTGQKKSAYSSVWRDIVLASFQMQGRPDADRYLRLLDDFLDAGAESEMPSFGTISRGQLRATIEETILEEFLQRLETNNEGISDVQLLAYVADKLLSKVSEETLVKEHIWKAICVAFPGCFGSQLQDKYLPQGSKMRDLYWLKTEEDISATWSIKGNRGNKRRQAVALMPEISKNVSKRPKT